MNFTELQTDIADELNLTSTTALARIGRNINKEYKILASSLGLKTIERRPVTCSTTIGSQYMTWGPSVMKLERIMNPNFTPWQPLGEMTVDEIRSSVLLTTDPAQNWAFYSQTANTVTVLLDSVPQSVYTLNADALVNLTTLAGADVPRVPEDFHDILQYGPRAVEYKKMEKDDDAKFELQRYEKRVAELRLYLALSGWLQLYQGKDSPNAYMLTTAPIG